jgi:hypothetical protein
MPSQCPAGQLDQYCTYALSQFSISTVRTYVPSIFFCVEIISSTLPLRKQRNTLRFGTIRLKWKTASGFPLRPYRTETYWWVCADWKVVYKSTYFRVYARIKKKSSSQGNFFAYYGSTNQSTFTKFWNLKTFLIRFGTVRLKWKTGFNPNSPMPMYFSGYWN